MLDAEESHKNDLRRMAAPITPEQLERIEKEGLCKEESLEIFATWYTFGGMDRRLSLTEILTIPAWLRRDFRYILSTMSTRRREREHEQETFTPPKPKKGARRATANGTKRR